MIDRRVVGIAVTILAVGYAACGLRLRTERLPTLDAAAAEKLVVGAAPQCCIEHHRPGCATNTNFTSCYSTGTPPATPPQCTNNAWFKLNCDSMKCVTGENPDDKCLPKYEMDGTKIKAKIFTRKANCCRRKGTFTAGVPCNPGYARCDYEQLAWNAAAGDVPAGLDRDTQVAECFVGAAFGTTFVKCANGQPANICN